LNLEKYRALFIEEATDHLGEMTRALAALERPAGPEAAPEAIDTLFRMAHSIKGMAASLDYLSISTLAHRLEDWLEPMRARGELRDDAFEALYLAVGALEQMVAAVAETGDAPPERADVLERLAELAPRPAGSSEKKVRLDPRPRRPPRRGGRRTRLARAGRSRASCGCGRRSSTASSPGSGS
jgi:two-component system chemotaxis sensor kinase CheA